MSTSILSISEMKPLYLNNVWTQKAVNTLRSYTVGYSTIVKPGLVPHVQDYWGRLAHQVLYNMWKLCYPTWYFPRVPFSRVASLANTVYSHKR